MTEDQTAAAQPMTWLDRYLMAYRIRMAVRELPKNGRLLDIGTHDGTLFRETGATGVGIDPELIDVPAPDGVTMIKGFFPGDLPQQDQLFDAATALAVTEHIPEEELATWAKSLGGMIAPGGAMVITVPAPTVDKILHLLIALRLIAGIEAHQHHGFQPQDLEKKIFTAPQWRRRKHRRFQLGLNHLYVFERTNA